jgi:dephospho-CoA kinase
MQYVIALTGGIGSGKSSVAAVFAELGAVVVDTDAIAHKLTSPGQAGAVKISAQFGAEYLCGDGSLDRERMRNLVFSDPAARRKLEAILHPLIRSEVNASVCAARGAYVVLVVPLLVETGAYRDLVRRVLVVDCSEVEQISRVRQRNGLDGETVRKIMASQVSRAERLAYADDVIVNDSDLATLQSRTAELHRRYLKLARVRVDRQKPPAKTKKDD